MKKVALILAGILIASGCAGSQGPGDQQLTIGFSQHRVAGSEWYKTLIEGAKAQARKRGVKVLVADAGGDATQQLSDIETFMVKGVDAVVVNALDPRGLGSAFDELRQERVPFVAVNSRLSEKYHRMAYCFVAENQEEAARKVGRELVGLC